jgi:subtilase family serine protease
MLNSWNKCNTFQKITRHLSKLGSAQLILGAAAFLLLAGMASAQDPAKTPTTEAPAVQADTTSPVAEIVTAKGTVINPESSVVHPEDAGVRAHTNYMIFVPVGGQVSSQIPPPNTFGETPASLGCVYQVGPTYAGCVPNFNTPLSHPAGGWGAIALVDAYDNPNAASDIRAFSTHFGLPNANFTKFYANQSYNPAASCSGTPPGNTGWGLEEDLDIEWAHAMAPGAKIYLVEACSNSYSDLLIAENMASANVLAAGGGDISNSWASGEFSGETSDDSNFRAWQPNVPGITYFASAGDSGVGAAYPSSSPWVVSAGGTTVNRDANGNFQSESCWSGSGGGLSTQELWQNPPAWGNGMGPWTPFQYPQFGQTGRQTPDLSFDADPASGVYMYDSYGYGGWVTVGGTSVASPSLAGIVNLSKNQLGQAPIIGGYYTSQEDNLLYSQLYATTAYHKNFYDVTTGSNGSAAGPYWDQCTGVGTPRGKLGK